MNKSLHAMEISPHSLYILNNSPLILFFNQPNDIGKIFRECWNFSESPIIIIETGTDFEIYNGYDYILQNGRFSLPSLNKEDINYNTILSGEYINNCNLFNNKKNRLDTRLLSNIQDARHELITQGLPKNIANSLIGRIVFIRYLIDRKVILNFEGNNKPLTNSELKFILSNHNRAYSLFAYLKSDDGFNGDWFPIIPNEKNLVDINHLNILIHLISGTEIRSKQQSLFDIYDFSIIPIEFISNVYESFIGEKEQSESGAYYTPTFLVDYILKNTIDKYFKDNPQKFNCKILDPACGSGIFLVEALRKIISQFEKIHNRKIKAQEITTLAKNNIYGIDKDYNAILISIFSLYLTMLDYQNPGEIKEFKFPYLLDKKKNPDPPNFFINDFFDTGAGYNEYLKNKNINFIIGNPPYGRGIANKNKFVLNYLKKTKLKTANADIVQPFMIRVNDIISPSTKISFIVTSKVFYNLQSMEFRNYFLNSFNIKHILELSSVMKEVFQNATVPVSILFYEKNTTQEIPKNTINYASIKPNPYFNKLKILMLSRNDFKIVKQSKLIEYDYLWKILVYGSYLDFNLIKRLKNFDTVEDHIESKAIGITVGNKNNAVDKKYIGMPYVQTKQFKPFYITSSPVKWQEEFVERVRTIDVFKAPALLLSKGISKSTLNIKMGIIDKDSIFTGSITSIKSKSKDTLYGIMGFMSSSFFKYFILHTASSIGVERPQLHNPEKFSLPYIQNNAVVDTVKELEEYSKNSFLDDTAYFNALMSKLDLQVLSTLNLNKQEYALIDYSNNVLIPWVIHRDYSLAFKKLSYQDSMLQKYANIYLENFSEIYKQSHNFFHIEILYSEHAIGMKFKVSSSPPQQQIRWNKEVNLENFLYLLGNQALENIFIQKDIKGFEENYFYIIKPNEYKNWHESIGYLDYNEFQDILLRSEV